MKGCSGKDLERRNVLSLERKSEWVMEYQITVRILRTAYVNKAQRVNFPMPYILEVCMGMGKTGIPHTSSIYAVRQKMSGDLNQVTSVATATKLHQSIFSSSVSDSVIRDDFSRRFTGPRNLSFQGRI